MVNRCFRHQHPEAYDRPATSEPEVPPSLRYGYVETAWTPQPSLEEEPMGNPEAPPL